jgi:hypothetical protein
VDARGERIGPFLRRFDAAFRLLVRLFRELQLTTFKITGVNKFAIKDKAMGLRVGGLEDSLTPGQSSPELLLRTVLLTGLGPNDLAIDIGSGDGFAVMALSALTACETIGVEIVESRYLNSLKVARRFVHACRCRSTLRAWCGQGYLPGDDLDEAKDGSRTLVALAKAKKEGESSAESIPLLLKEIQAVLCDVERLTNRHVDPVLQVQGMGAPSISPAVVGGSFRAVSSSYEPPSFSPNFLSMIDSVPKALAALRGETVYWKAVTNQLLGAIECQSSDSTADGGVAVPEIGNTATVRLFQELPTVVQQRYPRSSWSPEFAAVAGLMAQLSGVFPPAGLDARAYKNLGATDAVSASAIATDSLEEYWPVRTPDIGQDTSGNAEGHRAGASPCLPLPVRALSDRVSFLQGDVRDVLRIDRSKLCAARVVFVNNFNNKWEADGFQNHLFRMLSRLMAPGSILVSCSPFSLRTRETRNADAVNYLCDQRQLGVEKFTHSHLYLMVSGGWIGHPADGSDAVVQDDESGEAHDQGTTVYHASASTGSDSPSQAAPDYRGTSFIFPYQLLSSSLFDTQCEDVWRRGKARPEFIAMKTIHEQLRGSNALGNRAAR